MKVQILGITLGAASCFGCSVDQRAVEIAPVLDASALGGKAADASADTGGAGASSQLPAQAPTDGGGGDSGSGGSSGSGAGGSGEVIGMDAAVDADANDGLQD